MKNKFYIMTALVISLTGCSNIEDGTQPVGCVPSSALKTEHCRPLTFPKII